ncbi:MAG TPA: HigA family addiction module antitoxin [Stellaceae bacterium]|jgi:addiction module HigA family antidote|nr:HigA family addiction module antitoxin [Stellaceae bacterium]
MAKHEFAAVAPGEMLKEEFLAEYGLSQNQLAKAIGISPNRITDIVNNRRRITADTALRLSLYFGNSPEFWLNLQSPLRSEIGAAESQGGRRQANQCVRDHVDTRLLSLLLKMRLRATKDHLLMGHAQLRQVMSP